MTYRAVTRVSVAVEDIDKAMAQYEQLGLQRRGDIKESPRGLGLRWVEMGTDTTTLLELMTATDRSSALGRFLDRHGEGVYQVRLAVDDVDSTLDRVEGAGVRVVRDSYDGPGSRKLGWLHPASTHGVLFELVEGDEP